MPDQVPPQGPPNWTPPLPQQYLTPPPPGFQQVPQRTPQQAPQVFRTPPPKKNTWLSVVGTIFGVLLVLGMGAAISLGIGYRGVTETTVGDSTPSFPTPTAHPTLATPTPTVPTTVKDGTWIVGVDIAPGTYKSSGGSTDDVCMVYVSDKAGHQIGTGKMNFGGGSVTYTIPPDANTFSSSGCGTWTRTG